MTTSRAYVMEPTDRNGVYRISFPVQQQAIASLARFGKTAESYSGVFAGKEARNALRSGRDVTRDSGNVRRGMESRVRFHEWMW